jgi:hypothetical protein
MSRIPATRGDAFRILDRRSQCLVAALVSRLDEHTGDRKAPRPNLLSIEKLAVEPADGFGHCTPARLVS